MIKWKKKHCDRLNEGSRNDISYLMRVYESK